MRSCRRPKPASLPRSAHDGMARAIRPIHSMVDGDTVFCLASSHRPVAEDPMRSLFAFNTLLAAAADVFTDACLDAMLAARERGSWKSYTDLAPSVLRLRCRSIGGRVVIPTLVAAFGP